MIVTVNGVVQVPGIDYHLSKNSISFARIPPAASNIMIQGQSGVLANILGDGSTYLYQFMNDLDHETADILSEAYKLRHVPAIADQLERLQVVVELAKQ